MVASKHCEPTNFTTGSYHMCTDKKLLIDKINTDTFKDQNIKKLWPRKKKKKKVTASSIPMQKNTRLTRIHDSCNVTCYFLEFELGGILHEYINRT